MAAFNGAKYIRLAIDSVLSQDFDAFEFVIVDDCSTDRTPAIIKDYRDPRIVYLRNAVNLGQTRSLNIALAHAQSEFIARIDADDIYLAGKLARQYAVMTANPEVAVCGTWAIKMDAQGNQIGVHRLPVRPADVRFRSYYRVPLCHVSVMMRRSIVLQYGGYPERYRYAADYALWSTLINNQHAIINVPQPLVKYRQFTESLGAVHKLGAAGDESADIIEANVRGLTGVTLTREECRDIALLYFPRAGLSPMAICRAYVNLRSIARQVYRTVPIHVSVELLGVLLWALVKKWAYMRGKEPGRVLRRGLWTALRRYYRHPGIVAMSLTGYGVSIMGERCVLRLKQSVLSKLNSLQK